MPSPFRTLYSNASVSLPLPDAYVARAGPPVPPPAFSSTNGSPATVTFSLKLMCTWITWFV